MSSWQPYQAGLQPPAESWYQPDYMPSPVSPSYSQLVSPPPGLPFLPSPPTYATTDSAVASSMFINHYEPPLFDHHPQLLPSPRSLSIPSPLLSPDQALHPIPEYSHYGSMDSNSTTSSRTAEDRMRNQHIEFESSQRDGPRVFVQKLYQLLNNPQLYGDVIQWDPDGTTFIIAHRRRLVDVVLPQLFGHGNAASFTRQLNVYSFARLTASALRAKVASKNISDLSGWTHPLMRRGDDSQLTLIVPRPSKARLAKQAAKRERVAQREAERGAGSHQ